MFREGRGHILPRERKRPPWPKRGGAPVFRKGRATLVATLVSSGDHHCLKGRTTFAQRRKGSPMVREKKDHHC